MTGRGEPVNMQLKGRYAFRTLVRLVVANLFWLADLDDDLAADNVLRNIQKLTRKKVKKSTLNLKQKLILSKPLEIRTDEEKQMLDLAISGLKCFRKYPPNVKAQLAAVTYFVYLDAGRVIYRQDHLPSSMCFLLSGEASITVAYYDKMLKEWVYSEQGTVGPGTMFGEVALLHGIARTATIVTIEPCELLMIKKEDFDIVLKETVLKAWEAIYKIMDKYSYFSTWDEVTKRECSIYARQMKFAPDQTLLGDDLGFPSYVYLVTKGSCILVEHMLLKVVYKKGVKTYKLFIPENDEQDKAIGRKCHEKVVSETSMIGGVRDARLSVYYPVQFSPFFRGSEDSGSSGGSRESNDPKFKLPFANSTESLMVDGLPNVETHFMKVCEFTEGAVFNLGEDFQRRRVIAQTKVSCLLIPRYWLMKTNKDKLWNRLQQFLNNNVPTTQQIFKQFLEDRKFDKYKKGLVRDLLQQKRVPNVNSMHNVPYTIRLKEGWRYEL